MRSATQMWLEEIGLGPHRPAWRWYVKDYSNKNDPIKPIEPNRPEEEPKIKSFGYYQSISDIDTFRARDVLKRKKNVLRFCKRNGYTKAQTLECFRYLIYEIGELPGKKD